jgi:hypothetical protein
VIEKTEEELPRRTDATPAPRKRRRRPPAAPAADASDLEAVADPGMGAPSPSAGTQGTAAPVDGAPLAAGANGPGPSGAGISRERVSSAVAAKPRPAKRPRTAPREAAAAAAGVAVAVTAAAAPVLAPGSIAAMAAQAGAPPAPLPTSAARSARPGWRAAQRVRPVGCPALWGAGWVHRQRGDGGDLMVSPCGARRDGERVLARTAGRAGAAHSVVCARARARACARRQRPRRRGGGGRACGSARRSSSGHGWGAAWTAARRGVGRACARGSSHRWVVRPVCPARGSFAPGRPRPW